jgi:hypothetical protein
MERRAKWTGRGDVANGAKCVVPGCGGTAVAAVRIDGMASRAWLVDRATSPDGQDLCRRHADALEPGPGWTVYDERSRTRRLNPSVDGSRRARARSEALAPPPVALPGVDLRRGNLEPEALVPDTNDEPEGPTDLLDAQSPLLARAFAKSRD